MEGKWKFIIVTFGVIISLAFIGAVLFFSARLGGLWGMTIWIVIAGAVGGVVNSIINGNGFELPGPEAVGSMIVYRTGYIGNIFVGAVAALLSWGLYGPFSTYYIIGGTANIDFSNFGLTLFSLVGAILIGIGGSKWITSEMENRVYKLAASLILKNNNRCSNTENRLTNSAESVLLFAQGLDSK
jgi:hypothetical protein